MSAEQSETPDASTPEPSSGKKSFLKQLGPGLITAAVVVGPGTITVSSKVGAGAGASLMWALIIAGSFMMLYTSMAARIGVMNDESALSATARHYGRWLAITLGVLSFTVAAAFQSSNYIACATALQSLLGGTEMTWMLVVAAAALVFVLAARKLYKTLEKVMTALVGVMVLAFVVNLLIARPSIGEFFGGLVPGAWPVGMEGLIIAMFATTFSVIAALYQSTLARQKGWKKEDVGIATRESMFGIAVLTGISMMVMMTSATVLKGATIGSASDLSSQLEPLLGKAAVVVFSLGFLAAGFSSTVINAMIGGGLLADGLGYESDVNSKHARNGTVAAMAVGVIAGGYLLAKGSAIGGIVIAQRMTILAVPLVAIVLVMLANDKRVVGEKRNSLFQNIWAVAGLLFLLVASYKKISDLLAG